MARRSDHSRDELRAMAIAAARDIIAREGYPALTARGVAREIGYSVGTIYNLFDDLDDLVVHVNGETFDQLYDDLSADRPALGLEQALLDIGRRYVAFVSANRGLWNAIFDHRMPAGRPLPDWYAPKIDRLFALVETELEPIFPDPGMRAERRRAAAMLWSSLHGLCTLWQSDKMRLVESAPLADLATAMISTFVAGLRAGTGQ